MEAPVDVQVRAFADARVELLEGGLGVDGQEVIGAPVEV